MGSLSRYLSTISVPATSSFHIPTFGTNVLFILLIVVFVFLFALSLGRTRVLISLLSIYAAFTLQTMFPFFGSLEHYFSSVHDLSTMRVLVFLVLYILVFAVLNKPILKMRFNLAEAAFVSVVAMAVIQIGLLLSIILNLAPNFYGIGTKIPAAALPYFANQHALFYWAIAPLIIVILSKTHED